MNNLGNTSISGRHLIDSIAVLLGIMQYIEGYQLLDNNNILYLDYRAYLIDANFEEYFNDNFSSWGESENVIINPVRKSHRSRR